MGKSVLVQLIRKYFAFYAIRMFNAVFTSAHHSSHYKPSARPTSVRSTLNIRPILPSTPVCSKRSPLSRFSD